MHACWLDPEEWVAQLASKTKKTATWSNYVASLTCDEQFTLRKVLYLKGLCLIQLDRLDEAELVLNKLQFVHPEGAIYVNRGTPWQTDYWKYERELTAAIENRRTKQSSPRKAENHPPQ